MGKGCTSGAESGQVLMLIILQVSNDGELGSKGNGPVDKADSEYPCYPPEGNMGLSQTEGLG